MHVQMLTFNDFQENTYVLWDDTKECVLIDPGCYRQNEKDSLSRFITKNDLTPVRLLNTHCHIDHVLGVHFVEKEYGLKMETHRGELPVLRFVPQMGAMYGVPVEPISEPTKFLDEGDVVQFGSTQLSVLFTPGHSPASICFFHSETGQLIAGDVLFQGSIGRTDLPGGDFDTLISSITTKLLDLGDHVVVYPGHGPSTTIGQEKRTNPFLI